MSKLTDDAALLERVLCFRTHIQFVTVEREHPMGWDRDCTLLDNWVIKNYWTGKRLTKKGEWTHRGESIRRRVTWKTAGEAFAALERLGIETAFPPEEVAFRHPLRKSYFHHRCGETTTIATKGMVEEYARNPASYPNSYCQHCRTHFSSSEFVWSDEEVLVSGKKMTEDWILGDESAAKGV